MKIQDYSDSKILSGINLLVIREREVLAEILLHLREIDNRKLYSDMKCGSLFEYCIRILKYSEGQASRRVTASRLLREMPEILEKIQDGSLNLMQLNQAKMFFRDENITDVLKKRKIFEEISGKSTKESEDILDRLRSDDSPKKVRITIKETTLNKVKQVHALKAHAFVDIDGTIEAMANELLKQWDPRTVSRHTKRRNERSRYVPVEVKAAVWSRDEGRCRNCGSTFALQFDHKKSFSRGGKTNIENLELLCRNCNQRKGSDQIWPMSPNPQVLN